MSIIYKAIQHIKVSFKNLNKIRQFSTANILRSQADVKYKPNLRLHQERKEIGPFGWFLLTIPTATFALGTWQIQRKKWKENLIRNLHERKHATPVVLPPTLEEVEKLEYYPVHVRGVFLHDKEVYIGPRSLLIGGDASTQSSLFSKQNTSQGFLVITPFKLSDRNEIILVNRGWVAAKNRNPNTRLKGQIQGEVDIVGVVRLHENRPNFMPKNREGSNIWFYRDLEQMSEITGTSPIFLDATTDFDIEEGPIGGQTRISLRNEHLSYIMTWYSLSGITSYMWYRQFLHRI